MSAATARTPELSSKLPDVGTTIFTVMSTLAAEKKPSTSARDSLISRATRN